MFDAYVGNGACARAGHNETSEFHLKKKNVKIKFHFSFLLQYHSVTVEINTECLILEEELPKYYMKKILNFIFVKWVVIDFFLYTFKIPSYNANENTV